MLIIVSRTPPSGRARVVSDALGVPQEQADEALRRIKSKIENASRAAARKRCMTMIAEAEQALVDTPEDSFAPLRAHAFTLRRELDRRIGVLQRHRDILDSVIEELSEGERIPLEEGDRLDEREQQLPSPPPQPPPAPPEPEPEEPEDSVRSTEYPVLTSDTVMAFITEHFGDHMPFVARGLAVFFGTDTTAIRKALRPHVDAGRLEQHGRARGTFYRLAREA